MMTECPACHELGIAAAERLNWGRDKTIRCRSCESEFVVPRNLRLLFLPLVMLSVVGLITAMMLVGVAFQSLASIVALTVGFLLLASLPISVLAAMITFGPLRPTDNAA
jgi:hypothetical protein